MVAQNIYRYLWVIRHYKSKSSRKPQPKQVLIIIKVTNTYPNEYLPGRIPTRNQDPDKPLNLGHRSDIGVSEK